MKQHEKVLLICKDNYEVPNKKNVVQLQIAPSIQDLAHYANLDTTKEIFFLFENDDQNIRLTNELQSFKKSSNLKSNNKLVCYSQISENKLKRLLNDVPLFKGSHENFDAKFINIDSVLTSNLVSQNPVYKHINLDQYLETGTVTIGVIGKGSFRDKIVLELIRQNAYGIKKKIKVVVFDEEYTLKVNTLFDVVDIEIVNKHELKNYGNELDILYVAYYNEYLCYNEFIKLQQTKIICNKNGAEEKINLWESINKIILISVKGEHYIDEAIQKHESDESNINKNKSFYFATGQNITFDNIELYQKAEQIHNIYVSMSPNSTPKLWEDLSEEERDANRYAALFVDQHLYFYKYLINKGYSQETVIDILAEKEHHRWLVEKLIKGYVHDTITSSDLKTNNLLLPWTLLSEGSRNYNHDFISRIIKENLN